MALVDIATLVDALEAIEVAHPNPVTIAALNGKSARIEHTTSLQTFKIAAGRQLRNAVAGPKAGSVLWLDDGNQLHALVSLRKADIG